MNNELSRAEAMRQAGYSKTSAEFPARVENSAGFKLAMAGIFAQSGNVSMALLNEIDAKINAGELEKIDIGKLVNYFDVMTRAMERIAPKETKSTSDDMTKIFAGIVGGETGETLDNKDDNQSSDLTSIVKDSIIKDIVDNETGEMSSEPLTDSPASDVA